MLYGGTQEMVIHFNQDSLWEGNADDTGWYQSFGHLTFKFDKQIPTYQKYQRELDISTATHHLSYTAGGTTYQRTAFSSTPKGAIILQASADKPAQYSGTISLIDDHGTQANVIGNDTIQFQGSLKNGMRYAAKVKVINHGGTLTNKGNQLHVTNANSLQFILIANTDYIPDHTKKWKGEDPLISINQRIKTIANADFLTLKKQHIDDYQQFYKRVAIDLGTSDQSLNKLNTEARLLRFWKDRNDPDLEELIFNYGRYLLISSSRPGTLPANLQGIWNQSNKPPWRCDYHSDINVDMNYWLAETTNLSELRQPFFNYVLSQLPVSKINTKKKFGFDGYAIQYENGIHGGGSYRWNHSGASWFAQQFWDHYSFTLDKKFLKTQALPVFRSVCEFWEHWLIEKDGQLIAPNGWSAEHGPTEDGVTYDQQFAWDAFTNYIDACKILGNETAHTQKIIKLREKLMPLKIGKWGQLQEWLLVDRDKKQEKHRHLSHLIGFYPGRQINSNTPNLLEAAKISLNARGDKGAGWALPWKAAAWARFGDGNRAHKLLVNKLNPILTTPGRIRSGIDGTSPNLFTIVWGVIQIDGSLGYPAAVAEMLLQSNEAGKVHLLPALPDAWKNGSVKGFKARGGHSIDITWKDGKLTHAVIKTGQSRVPTVLVQGKPIKATDPRINIQ